METRFDLFGSLVRERGYEAGYVNFGEPGVQGGEKSGKQVLIYVGGRGLRADVLHYSHKLGQVVGVNGVLSLSRDWRHCRDQHNGNHTHEYALLCLHPAPFHEY